MVEPYHGYKYVKKGQNINTPGYSPILNTIPTPTQNIKPNQQVGPLPASGLPILIPANLGTGQPQLNKKIFNHDKYKDLLIEKPDIKYLPPEIIAKESIKKYESKFRDRKSGEIKIVDTNIAQNIQKAIDSFLRKTIYNQIGKKWIETARMLKNANIIK